MPFPAPTMPVEIVANIGQEDAVYAVLERIISGRPLGQPMGLLRHPSAVNEIATVHELVELIDTKPFFLGKPLDALPQYSALPRTRMNQDRQKSFSGFLGPWMR
jgi:hypothetical protein